MLSKHCLELLPRLSLEERRGEGGLGPKILCTINGPITFSLLQILFFPTMVTLGLGGGGAPPMRVRKALIMAASRSY